MSLVVGKVGATERPDNWLVDDPVRASMTKRCLVFVVPLAMPAVAGCGDSFSARVELALSYHGEIDSPYFVRFGDSALSAQPSIQNAIDQQGAVVSHSMEVHDGDPFDSEETLYVWIDLGGDDLEECAYPARISGCEPDPGDITVLKRYRFRSGVDLFFEFELPNAERPAFE